MSSLLSQKSDLASLHAQREMIERPAFALPTFSQKLQDAGLFPLRPKKIQIFQINVGKVCNQTCRHCHVDAGPDRKEMMTRETMQKCLDLVRKYRFPIVDITGGAPELNPNFRWFVQSLRELKAHVIHRCNLTILVANQSFMDLPEFFKENEVEVVSSLPHFSKTPTDRQRGEGVFEKSIQALQSLNAVGYGLPGTGLHLNLVYNPSGCFLPGDQSSLESEFKRKLSVEFNVEFNSLFCITNMPIHRYLAYLIETGNYEFYMRTLVHAFNPSAAEGVMCRNTISVSWDGKLYDCDFNQMLDVKMDERVSQSLDEFDVDALESRTIAWGQHCYGCTAGKGSSCGGEVV